MNQDHLFDVAIVGCGPTGAVLANLLGQSGLSVIVFERESSTPSPLPRAIHFDGECMRVFQSIGLAERMSRVARVASAGTRFMSPTGQVLLTRRSSEQAGPHGWALNWYFHQPNLERELRQGLERFPSVVLKFDTEVSGLQARADGVTIRVTDHSDRGGAEYGAKYVVGCDGARSLVRASMNSRFDDLGLHQQWFVVDVLGAPDSQRFRALPDYTIQLCDPNRPMTIIHVQGNRRRWEIMVMPGDDAARMAQPERFWPMLSRWLDPRDVQSVERSAVYTFHSLIARGWRDARLLLAGDACHQTPPFLGQGMCAGIRDAANLSWKLAAVLRGKAAPALLDSYETERRPHVETFIQLAVKLGDIIQTTDPAVAAERDRRFAAGDPALLEVPSPLLGPGAHAEGGWPHGSILPQPRTPDGRLWDEVTAGWFCVIGERALLNAADEETCAIWRRLDARVHAVDVTPDARRLLDLTGAAALILRPDAYVFGTAKDAAGLMSLSRQLPVKLHLA